MDSVGAHRNLAADRELFAFEINVDVTVSVENSLLHGHRESAILGQLPHERLEIFVLGSTATWKSLGRCGNIGRCRRLRITRGRSLGTARLLDTVALLR